MDKSILEKFESSYMPVTESGCWIWCRSTYPSGYGTIFNGTRNMPAHRWSYEHFREPIPQGMWIDHKCRVKSCVNPDHLRVVTPRINAIENSDSATALNARKTHCSRGHEFTPENTRVETDLQTGYPTRRCLECCRDNDRRKIIRRREARIKALNSRHMQQGK